MLELIIAIAFFGATIVFVGFFITEVQYSKFQKEMKVGDLCTFFIDNEETNGVIKETNGVIKEINEDKISIARGDLKSWTIPPYFIRKKKQVYPK